MPSVPVEAGWRWVVCYLFLLMDFSIRSWYGLSLGLVFLRGAVPSGCVWAGWRHDNGFSGRLTCWVGVVWTHKAETWKCLKDTRCAVKGSYTMGMSAPALANSPRVLCQSGHNCPDCTQAMHPHSLNLCQVPIYFTFHWGLLLPPKCSSTFPGLRQLVAEATPWFPSSSSQSKLDSPPSTAAWFCLLTLRQLWGETVQ